MLKVERGEHCSAPVRRAAAEASPTGTSSTSRRTRCSRRRRGGTTRRGGARRRSRATTSSRSIAPCTRCPRGSSVACCGRGSTAPRSASTTAISWSESASDSPGQSGKRMVWGRSRV